MENGSLIWKPEGGAGEGSCVMCQGRFKATIAVRCWLTLIAIGCLVGMEGCTVGPNYKKPPVEVPKQWNELPAKGISPEAVPVDLTRWWALFQDEELNSLIERAIESNKDLRVAEARIREARAQRGVVASRLFPTVNASASYMRSHEGIPSGGSASGVSSSRGGSTDQNLFQAGFDASWEIDVFGGTRRAVEAANADIQVSEENRRAVLVTLLSEVARNYLDVRGSQIRLGIAQNNIESQKNTLDLTRERFRVGLASDLQVAQAEAQLTATEATVPLLETALKQDIHHLGVLLGQEPGALMDELLRFKPLPPRPPEVPVGLPSELLRQRPDIRSAERQLAAATARIGVATADLFPKFFLTGAAGYQSINVSDFGTSGSKFWSFGPSVQWPVFDAGRIRSNIKVQDARQEQSLVAYEQAVLVALEDVENALVAYSKEQVRRTSLAESVASNQRATDIANELYAKGLVDFLNVLVNQRALFQSQDALAQSDQNVSAYLVSLFKALGGGWEVAPE